MRFIAAHPFRSGGAVLLLAITAAWMVSAARWQDTFVIEDSFLPSDRIRAYMDAGDGVPTEGGGLAMEAGSEGVRRYFLHRRKDHRLFIRIAAAPQPNAGVEAVLVYRSEEIKIPAAGYDGRPIDLTPLTNEGKNVLELRLFNRAPEGSPPAKVLDAFAIERWAPEPTMHWGAFLFFAALAGYFWFVVAIGFVPSVVKQLAGERGSLECTRRNAWMMGALVVLGAFALVTTHPSWDERKDYDDRAAISNGALLLDTGYDPAQMYFRSRVRPAFPAIIQPLLVLSPHRFDSYWLNPSDNFARDWFIYDQDNWSYGLFTYPLLSFMSMGFALLTIAGFYSIYRRAEVSLLTSGVATALAAVFLYRALAIPITQVVNLFSNVLAVWAFLAWGMERNYARTFFAGTVLGFAFLEKETASTTAICIGLFLLMESPVREAPRRVVGSLPFWVGAAVWPLVYFGFVSDGGFAEIFENFSDHLRQQEINQFESLTLASGIRDLWVVFSVGLPLGIAGLVYSSARRLPSKADRLFLAWAIGCLPVFTLPYIFPRFLQFFIPAFAFWTALMATKFFHLWPRSRPPV